MSTVPDGTHPGGVPVGPLVAVVACVLVVASATAAVAPVAAATTTELSLVAEGDTTVAPGDSVTYEVVVGQVDGGVGSYIVAVNVTDASVATITDASDRTGGESRVEFADDGSSVRIGAFAGNTTDDGTDVAVATVTVTGQSAGTADLRIEPRSVSDEDGDAYTLINFFDATITVDGAASPTDDGTPTDDATPTTADGTPTPDDATPTTADGTPTDAGTTPASPTPPPTTDATTVRDTTPTDGSGDGGTGGTDTTTTGSPGFGAAAAAVALLGAVLLTLRRRD